MFPPPRNYLLVPNFFAFLVITEFSFLAFVQNKCVKKVYDNMQNASAYWMQKKISHRAHWIANVFFHEFGIIIVIISYWASYGHLSYSYGIPHSWVIPQRRMKNAFDWVSCDIGSRQSKETWNEK